MPSYPVQKILGTTQQVIATTSDIAAGNFSGAPAATFDNTIDEVVPMALWAHATIRIPDFGGVPVANTTVQLWGLLKDVTNGTDDDTQAPSGSTPGGAILFGEWNISADDAVQRRTIRISLEEVVSKVDFYIKNGTAQNMNNDAGTSCTVDITPYSVGIAA